MHPNIAVVSQRIVSKGISRHTLGVRREGIEVLLEERVGNSLSNVRTADGDALRLAVRVDVVERIGGNAVRVVDTALAVRGVEPVHAARTGAASAVPALGAGPEQLPLEVLAAAVAVALGLGASGEPVEDGGVAVRGRVGAANTPVVAEHEAGTCHGDAVNMVDERKVTGDATDGVVTYLRIERRC